MPLDTTRIIEEPSSGLWKNGENPDVYVDIYGTTHVTWVAKTGTGKKRIFYIFDDGSLNFNSPDLTIIGTIDRNCNNPKIAANRSGRVLIVFEMENPALDGTDIHLASNDGLQSLSVSIDISRNSGTARFNRNPRLVINDETKDPHFVWLGTHPTSGKTVPFYTRENSTTLIPTTHIVTPDINNDCDNIDIALMGNQNKVFVTFQQLDGGTSKTNIRLAEGNETGFSLDGDFVDSLSFKILSRPTLDLNHMFPRIAVRSRIRDIIEAPGSDSDPRVVVVWEDDGSPNSIRFIQRNATDYADGTVATSGVHRPSVCVNHNDLILVAYYKTIGPNNIVNLSFKDVYTNVWTEATDIANGHASGDGIYNIEILPDGSDNVYISFKTGPTTGPQRIIHVNNFRTNNLFSFEIFTTQLDSPSDTRSAVAMHLDDKIGNRVLASDSPSRAAVVFSDYTINFAEPDGIGDIYVFGGVVTPRPKIIAVTDVDGDNRPEFSWFMPGEHSEGFFDIYFRLCGASGIIPYQENVMLSGTFVPSGIDGFPEPGYVFSHEGPSGINFAELYGFGIRERQGPWSEEFCFRLGDISVSNPTIIPPNNKVKIEKCDIVSLGGSAEPGSTIESQTLIEYSDADGTIELNRTIITNYLINLQGNYSGSMALSLLPGTASIRAEVIARDSDGNLSQPAESVSNLVVVQNVPPVFISIELESQATASTTATNSTTINVDTVATGDVFEMKLWESVVDGGTGEIGASWVPYNPEIPFTFANSINGTKTIFCKLRDSCGNESSILSDEIELDTVPPQLIAASYNPATRRLTLSFSEPVTSIDLSKVRIVKP